MSDMRRACHEQIRIRSEASLQASVARACRQFAIHACIIWLRCSQGRHGCAKRQARRMTVLPERDWRYQHLYNPLSLNKPGMPAMHPEIAGRSLGRPDRAVLNAMMWRGSEVFGSALRRWKISTPPIASIDFLVTFASPS